MRVLNRPGVALAVILATVAGGCASNPEGLPASCADDRGGRGARAKELGAGVFGQPIVLDGWDYVFVPYSVVRREAGMKFYPESFLGSFVYSSSFVGGAGISLGGGGPYRGTGATHLNNLALYDKRSGESRLLLGERLVIVKMYFPGAAPAEPGKPAPPPPPPDVPPHLLLACARADTNGDRVINGEDATVLYHVALPGGSMTPLTPDGTRFDDFEADEGGRVLYVRSVLDSDGDRRFTPSDEAVIARVDAASPAPGTPLVPDDLRSRAFAIIAGEPR